MLKSTFSNHEVVTLAVYLLGGESRPLDTEDVAIKANEIAPGRFVWRKYPDQVNLEIIRVYLSDAKKPDKGGYLIGSGKDGWQLSEKGLEFAKRNEGHLQSVDLQRENLSAQERNWRRAERSRIALSDALARFNEGGADAVPLEDIEAMFRVNSYVVGKAREKKVTRILNIFGEDPEIGPVVRELATRLKETS